MKFDAGPQLERPGLVVVRMGPGERELRYRLALVVEGNQRIENRRGRGERRGVEHPDLQRIKTGNVEFEAEGNAAALLLGAGGSRNQSSAKSRKKAYSRKHARARYRLHSMFPPGCRPSGIPGSLVSS